MWAVLLALAVVGAPTVPTAERSPILITFDLHMDPLGGIPNPSVRERVFREWCAAAEWLLDQAEPRGAKVSFLTGGEFAERCLAAPDTFPLLRRLYESGGSIGTHSHDWVRQGPHEWFALGPRADADGARRVWRDDVALVDELVGKVLGLTDPAAIRAVNNVRGTHLPADAAARYALYREYGFEVIQAGPGEDFAGLFHHYLYHPIRPNSRNEIAEDRDSPVILTQAGPVLGSTVVHKGVPQDMSLPRVQAMFLAELLCWLQDLRSGAPDRVWCFGWAVHGSDIIARGVSRPWVEPTLDWFDRHFIGRSIGGHIVAAYGSYHEEAQAYRRWEQAHPDLPGRGYPSAERDWQLYPWAAPVAAYLWDARYIEALRSDDLAQLHRLVAPEPLGGYPLVVGFPLGDAPVAADLTTVDPGPWQRVDPATGTLTAQAAAAVEIPPAGAIYIPHAVCRPLGEQIRAIDSRYDRRLPGSGAGPRSRDLIADFDRNRDGRVSRDEFPGPPAVFARIDNNRDGFIDLDEAAAAPPPGRPANR